MEHKKLKLSEILNRFEKENSGVILGNGFCTWLYEKVEEDKKLPKRYKDWNLNGIIKDSIDLFHKNNYENIDFILETNDVDNIYKKIIEKRNEVLANKWLICFLKEILKRVNHDRIKKSLNLNKLKHILEKVEFKFTTNYDPSFYWLSLRMKKNTSNRRTWKQILEDKRGGVTKEFDDGFDKNEDEGNNILKFIKPEDSKIFYLHGAIFLIEKYLKNEKTIKISGKGTNKDFISICEKYLESINDDFSLFTVIGEEKNKQIQKSQYLSFSLNKLKKCNNIITFGLSFSEDLHLLENIIKECKEDNEEKYLYIACYDFNKDDNSNPRFNFESYFKNNIKPDNLNIIFYDSKDIDDLNI